MPEVLPMNTVGMMYSSPGDIQAHAMDREIVAFPVTAATVDTNIYVAIRPVRVTAVREVHTVAGSDVGAVTLAVTKCTGTTAPASGTAVHAGTADLKGTANTVQTLTLSTTLATLTLAAGDRLAIDVTGTLTAVAGGVVIVELQPL